MKNALSFNFREQEQNPLCTGFEIYVVFSRVHAQFSQNVFEPQHIWREDLQHLQMNSSEFEQQSSQYLIVICERENEFQSHCKHQVWPHTQHQLIPAWYSSSVLESTATEPEYL